jgi:hypothetical protein
MLTIEEIYTAINPLPAKLTAKGKANPTVEVRIEANAGISITMNWTKLDARSDWDKDYHVFLGTSFDEALRKAIAFVNELPSADQAKLRHFMGQLGRLIDTGKSVGIDVDYLNPLLDTMKRLSENVITHQRKGNP